MTEIPQPAGLPASLTDRGRPLVFGVLNVTPDSFSDGGRYADVGAAVSAGVEMAAQGADVIDVGGESTRPGAARVTPDVEMARVLPVITALAGQGIAVSVDTMDAEVAAAAAAAGAVLVNDVSAGQADPRMLSVLAGLEIPYVVMHWRGHGYEMDGMAEYHDVVQQVRGELDRRVAACLDAGISRDRIVIDPGLGFAKTAIHNWQLLRDLSVFTETGLPVLVGASRKRFLGALLAQEGTPRDVSQREAATIAVSALATFAGAWAVRVHEVRGNADAVRVARAWMTGGQH